MGDFAGCAVGNLVSGCIVGFSEGKIFGDLVGDLVCGTGDSVSRFSGESDGD